MIHMSLYDHKEQMQCLLVHRDKCCTMTMNFFWDFSLISLETNLLVLFGTILKTNYFDFGNFHCDVKVPFDYGLIYGNNNTCLPSNLKTKINEHMITNRSTHSNNKQKQRMTAHAASEEENSPCSLDVC